MREINSKEALAVSGADIGYTELMDMWDKAGVNTGLMNYDRESKSINELGFASATEQKGWSHAQIGEAGWLINMYGNKVTWFNNGVFMAFRIEY